MVLRSFSVMVGLAMVACAMDTKPGTEIEVDIDSTALGAADAAGPLQGELVFGELVEASLTRRNWYHLWNLSLDATQTVFIDLASRAGSDMYVALYRQSGRGYRNVAQNDDCGDSLNSCLELSLDAGAYIVLATTYEGVIGQPESATYHLTATCRTCEAEPPVCDDGPGVVVRYDTDFCTRAFFTCDPGTEYFSDECGCGCREIPAGSPELQIVRTLPDAGDSYSFVAASLEGNTLSVTVRYGGGCEEHEFNLYWDGSLRESLPQQAALLLTHDANGDRCRALPTQTLEFDVSRLLAVDPEVVISVNGPGGVSIGATRR